MATESIDFSRIGITDDLMFGTVFEDPTLCKELIEVPLDIRVESLEFVQRQTRIDAGPLARAGVVDLLVRDSIGNVFDLEMQNQARKELPLRARYYLSLLDTTTLGPGEDFEKLHGAVVVFICSEDPFGRGWKRYSFPRLCTEDGKPLGDATNIVFINAKGTRGDYGKRFDAFLHYLKDDNDIEDAYVQKLDSAVQSWRDNPLWRRYRVLWSLKYEFDMADARKEGRREGEKLREEQLSKLAKQLEATGRTDELAPALQNKDKLQKLLNEFGIS